jgi:hypothetical protein
VQHRSAHANLSQSTVETELATLAADGFARLLADNGHAPARNGDARPAADGGGGAFVPSARHVLTDCELGRLCQARKQFSEHRLWLYGIKSSDGSGRILKSELYTQCIQLGIVRNRRTFNDILQRGNHFYWKQRGNYIYLAGWKRLAKRQSKWAAKHAPDLVATNLPGQRRVWLDLTGSHQQGHVAIYNAWLGIKAEKNGYLDISRWTLTRLWRRSVPALLRWERLAGIRIEHRYAEHADIHNPLIPAHANLCLDKDGSEFASWRLSNRFYPAPIQSHGQAGQRKKVRSACRVTVDKFEPTVIKPGGQRRVKRIGRINFHDKTSGSRFTPAHKSLDQHLRKHNDIFDRPHYAYMARRYGKHIYEMSDGTPARHSHAERDRVGEKSVAFRLRQMQYRIGWAYRCKGF